MMASVDPNDTSGFGKNHSMFKISGLQFQTTWDPAAATAKQGCSLEGREQRSHGRMVRAWLDGCSAPEH